MRMRLHIWALSLLALTCPASAQPIPVTFALEMDQDPQVLGWSISQGGGGSHTISKGLLGINSPTFYEFKAPTAVLQAQSNNAGWAVDTRFRFSGGSNDITLWFHDNSVLNIARIGANSIHVYAGAIGGDLVFPYSIGSGYHTYRWEAIGQRVRMFIDGNTAFDIQHLAPGGGTRTIFFGDGSFSFTTESEWDYFRITTPLPEPSQLVALLTGVGIMGTRRRATAPAGRFRLSRLS